MRGIAQAQSEFNENQGLNAKLLNIVIGDDNGEQTIAQKVAQEFIKDHRILGVIGHTGSSNTLAALDKYNPANLAIISATSTSTKLSGEEVFYRTVSSDQKHGKILAEYSKKEKIKKIAVFYKQGDSYSDSLKTEFENSLKQPPGNIGVVRRRNIGDQKIDESFETYLIYREKVDGVVFLPNIELISSVIKITGELAKDRSNLNQKIKILGGDTLYGADIIKQGKQNIEGLVLAIPWFAGDPTVKTFAEKACKRWEGGVSWRTAASYDATKAFLQAISRSKDLTRKSVLNNLKSVNLPATETSGYPLQFQNGELSQQRAVLVKVVKNDDQFTQKTKSDRNYSCKNFKESGFHLELVE